VERKKELTVSEQSKRRVHTEVPEEEHRGHREEEFTVISFQLTVSEKRNARTTEKDLRGGIEILRPDKRRRASG
jgi:hypothetical protein